MSVPDLTVQQSKEKGSALFEKAFYVEREEVWTYWCNPLIEALPVMASSDQCLKRLVVNLTYNPDHRHLPDHTKMKLLAQLYQLHIPTQNDLDIFVKVEQQLMNRYFACNPISLERRLRYIQEEKKMTVTDQMKRMLTAYHAPPLGFPVIGLSGTGKTCSVMNVLTLYPKAIQHTCYKDEPFLQVQIVWIHVNCPGDGSPRGLCIAILEEIDEILNTDYVGEYARPRATKDILITKVRKLLHTFHVGLIVIDDIQNLCAARGSAFHELQTFLMYLTNQLAIPIIRVGTPKFLQLIQNEFQLGKRTTGAGEIRMELYHRNSFDWNNFIKSLWRYQYTEKEVPLTDEMSDVFFEESVGNVFIASLLYKLVQEQSISLNRKIFTQEDVRDVSRNKIGITAKKRRDMLNGIDLETNEYRNLWNICTTTEEAVGSDTVSDRDETNTALSKKQSVDTEMTVEQKLREKYHLSVEDARKYTRQTLITELGISDPEICAGLAYARYYAEHGKDIKSEKKREEPSAQSSGQQSEHNKKTAELTKKQDQEESKERKN